jgi:hypothetical protein
MGYSWKLGRVGAEGRMDIRNPVLLKEALLTLLRDETTENAMCYPQGRISRHTDKVISDFRLALIPQLRLNQTVGCFGTRFPGQLVVAPGYTSEVRSWHGSLTGHRSDRSYIT